MEMLREEEEVIFAALQQLGDEELLKSFKDLVISKSQNQEERP